MRWLILSCVACSTSTDLQDVDRRAIAAHVHELADEIGPRPGDSQASRAAAAYIASQVPGLEQFEVGGVDLPAIDVLGVRWRDAHHLDTTDPDLLVRFGPPSGKALLVTAHYDTVPPSPGAVDDAASVALLIELARLWRDHPPSQPVILAFTANEERGLVGAEALAERVGPPVELGSGGSVQERRPAPAGAPIDIGFAIALDLVGGSGPLVLNGASTLIREPELRWLARAADRAGAVLRAPLPHRVISRWWPQAERADHGAFTRRGIRGVHLYDRGQDGEWIDLAYHSPGDVSSRVDLDAVAEVGRILQALGDSPLPEAGGTDGFWLPLAYNTVVPRWTIVGLELALAAIAVVALVSFARGRQQRPRGAGALAAIGCFAVAVAAALAAERAFAGAHPAPWLHAPLRAELAETAVLAGVLGLATRIVARRWRWTGERRYLAIAIALPLAIGTAWLAAGAAELAWVWLVPAALAALAPRLGRAAPLALAGSLLPAVLVLAPAQLREASWNGFLPAALPLAAWLALFLAAPLALVAYLARRRVPGPLGTLVLPLGCGLAVAAGLAVLGTAQPPCSAREFQHFHLACEVAATWR